MAEQAKNIQKGCEVGCCGDDTVQTAATPNNAAATVKQVKQQVDDNHDGWKAHWDLLLALLILIVLLVLEYGFNVELPNLVVLTINLVAYILAGRNVLQLAFRKSKRGDFFNEFVLMSVATIGAFLIGEYEEGVAVMVFYQIGEWFQDAAVSRAKRNIKALLDIRPDEVTVIREGRTSVVDPSSVAMGETIQVKHGEKVALDGQLMTEHASFNTAALTGESKPDTKYKGEAILAGMINLNTVAELKVSALFKDSKLSRILEMVQDATARKSQTQLFISRFAKVYTPVVFFLALAVCVVPYFILSRLRFLYLVLPCAGVSGDQLSVRAGGKYTVGLFRRDRSWFPQRYFV
jgi:Zn2+/Cd2+-exporting ATPase